MATTASDIDAVRDIIERLRTPIEDLPTLLRLLAAPLASLGLLAPRFRSYYQDGLAKGSIKVSKHVPLIQEAILLKIVPVWEDTLRENDALSLTEHYFCPDAFWFSTSEAGDLALLAYSTILSLPITSFSIHLLVRLTRGYPIDRLYQAVNAHKGFKAGSGSREYQKSTLEWEDCAQNIVSVPAKVANAALLKGLIVPELLEHGVYLNNLCVRSEELIYTLATTDTSDDHTSSIIYLLGKLANVGVFPSTRPTARSQPSFFLSTLPTIRRRLHAQNHSHYSTLWNSMFDLMPSIFTTRSILTALLSSVAPKLSSEPPPGEGPNPSIKQDASLLQALVGHLNSLREELWSVITTIMFMGEWGEVHARILVCWVSGVDSDNIDEDALGILLERVVEAWSSPEHIKYSLLSHHQYLTCLLLFTVSYLPSSSPHLSSVALSPLFISAIGVYISHLDHAVRRCGMIAAEVIAQRTGRKLDFGDWDGDEQGKPWARALRKKLQYLDVNADDNSDNEATEPADVPSAQAPEAKTALTTSTESKVVLLPVSGYDSDDSLVGYASEPSSRSASPTPSELEEIEKDPTLNVGIKKVPRPVYLAQLGELLRDTSGKQGKDDPHDADKIEMGINCAEELVRKKRNYGSELEENAVNLVFALIGLQDNYNLDDFDHKRQAALTALVSGCPRKAAPAIIEQFFVNQYSIAQRYIMLNALAFGARELASLPIPPSVPTTSKEKISFPSKLLPGPLHSKYLAAGGQDPILRITDGISRAAIERTKSEGASKVPELLRERRLRIYQPDKIVEVDPRKRNALSPWQTEAPRKDTTYTEVAAEFFIIPFINRFWMFLRDEQTREERSAHMTGRARYHGAGTGLVLNPIILSHFLNTMTILVHASRNAPEWLAVIAPDALELALNLGTRPVSHMNDDDDGDDEVRKENPGTKEAAVLSACLELALTILDGCQELDGGRALGLEHTALLIGTGEWAGVVFSRLEGGVKAEGGGGAEEVRLRRAAAGVLLKVDEITSKWRRSMIDSVQI